MKWYHNILNLPQADIFLDELENTQQEFVWHEEGNCRVHTEMVLAEIEKIIVSEKLNETDSQILRMSGLLHDIAKPKVFSVDDGQIRSHGHTKLGGHISLELLYQSNLPFETIRLISTLVKTHGKPPWTIEQDDPQKYVIRLSHVTDTRLLYYLCFADNAGRKCADRNELLDKMEYFKEVCLEMDCFGKPYTFQSDHSKFAYFMIGGYYCGQLVYQTEGSKVYLMSGLPGVGKDYYVSKNFNLPVISLDNIRKEFKIKPTDEQGLVIQTAKERAKEFLRKKQDFVWNSTNTVSSTRKQLIENWLPYNPEIHQIYIHKTLDQILKQNSDREAQVPEKVITKLLRKLDIPESVECHTIKYIV